MWMSACDVTDEPRIPPNDSRSPSTYALCNKIWVDYYLDNSSGINVEHELTFSINGSGMDRRIFRYTTGTRVDNFPFRWRWFDNYEEGLIIEYLTPPYPDNEKIVYFDNIMIRNHYLSGELFNNYVTFVDSNIL